MASPTQWTWVWVNSRSWWWTRTPHVLQYTGSQRVRHHWATLLNWTEVKGTRGEHFSVGLYPHFVSRLCFILFVFKLLMSGGYYVPKVVTPLFYICLFCRVGLTEISLLKMTNNLKKLWMGTWEETWSEWHKSVLLLAWSVLIIPLFFPECTFISSHGFEKWKLLSCVWLFGIQWSIQSIEFSRPKYQSG